MSNNLVNKLKFILIAIILLLVLFTAIAFAVPFGNKFTPIFWFSFSSVYLFSIVAIFFLAVCINVEEYQKLEIANKVIYITIGFVLLSIVASIIFMAVYIEFIWIPIVVFIGLLVCKLLILFYITISNNNQDKEIEE